MAEVGRQRGGRSQAGGGASELFFFKAGSLLKCGHYIFFFLIFIYLFIYFWLCWVFVSVRGLSIQLRQAGATLHRGARASHCHGPSRCGAQAPDAQAQ